MLFLYDLLSCIGYFLVMLIFMILALTSAKPHFAWVWYIIGGISQFISLLGSQNVIQTITWYWVIYFAILIIVAALILNRGNATPTYKESNDTILKQPSNNDTETNNTKLEEFDIVADAEEVKENEIVETKTEEQENISDNIPQMDNVIITSKPTFCRKCGGKLTEDGLFCQYCGNKIVSEKSSEIKLKKNNLEEESKSNLAKNNTFVAKSTTKKKIKFTWLWVLLIIVNCFVAFVSTSESIHSLLFYIEKRAIISWCHHNIDPIYEIGYTQQEYVAAMRDNTEAIMLFAIVALLFVLLFVAISLVNTYICRRKLNVKRKLIKSLPWLCTLILTIVLCGSLTLYYVVEYADDIEYSYRRVEEEQAELEKKYIEEQKKEETQKLASKLLYSSIKPEMPNEVFENAQRYPKKVEGEFVKVSGYVNVSDTLHYFIEESAFSDRRILKFTYGLKSENSPNILDGDFVTIVGKIIEVRSNIKYDDPFSRLRAQSTYGTSGDLVVVEIYDWKIID